jgi:hypothetical protein
MISKIKYLFLLLFITVSSVIAGPPFDTDDPEPVDYLHWEFYVASVYQFGHSNFDGTLPHIEVNYGPVKNVQLHLLTGMGYAKDHSENQYGFMTAELGAKYRFINTDNGFQAGTFPLIELPTTNKMNLVGNRNVQVFIPIWIQKNWGKFTTYGGSGYWINTGSNNKNSIFTGWEAQYDFSTVLTLGGEIFYQTADTEGGSSDIAFKAGGFINVNEENHILLSFGKSLKTSDDYSGYIGYQLTI